MYCRTSGIRPAAIVAIAVIALGGSSHTLAAQPTRDSVWVLAGVIKSEEGATVAGAEILLVTAGPTPRVALTTHDGSFAFAGVRAGASVLRIRRIGFKPETVLVEVPQPAGGRIVIPLEAAVRRLETVVVRAARRAYTGPLAGFNRRKDAGFGHFITRAEIERRQAGRTTDLLRLIPGVTIAPAERNTGTGGAGGAARVRMRGSNCDPYVWMDGVPLGSGMFIDLDALSPSSIDGIEIYSGLASVPPELRASRGASACGTIAIWTRHGETRRRRREPVSADRLAQQVAEGRLYTADLVDVPAEVIPGYGINPIYPESLRTRGIAGALLAEFVVDTLGQVEIETMGIVSSSQPLFSDAVRAELPQARFIPATRRGVRVRQVVHMPVRFTPDSSYKPAP